MAVNLTPGAIPMLLSKEWQTSDPKPVLQVIDINNIKTLLTQSERYRVTLSDGSHKHSTMLCTQCNDLVTSHQLPKGSVIQLTDFVCKTFRSRVIVIISKLNVILSECDIIGDPKLFLVDLPASSAIPTYSTLNEPGTGGVYNPETDTIKEKLEESAKDQPNRKRSRTYQFEETSADSYIPSVPNIDSAKTTIELYDLERDMMKLAVTKPDGKKKRGPTFEECYDKLKGLGLEATDLTLLAAIGIFSQLDNYKESWMTLLSDPNLLKEWTAMKAISLGFMI